MKQLIFALLLITSSFSLAAQDDTPTNTRHLFFKTSPALPIMDGVNGGFEFIFAEKHAIEIEGFINNLTPKFTDAIYGYTSYDYNKYHSVSMRYKRYFKNSTMKNRNGLFNGLYIAPGFKLGTTPNNFYERIEVGYKEVTTDVGIALTFKKYFVVESFIGLAVTGTDEDITLRDYTTVGRSGFRLGIAF